MACGWISRRTGKRERKVIKKSENVEEKETNSEQVFAYALYALTWPDFDHIRL